MQQLTIYLILGSTLLMFISGRLRYDLIALLALLAVTLTGLVDANEAFYGFGHPAVVTVAAVFALGRGLQNSGVVDLIYKLVSKLGKGSWTSLALMCSVILLISGFMNNIGALVLLLPVAIKAAKDCKKSPSQFLMPLAFSSILGGMVTMIGTPPNIIVAMLREDVVGTPFKMFDFAYVGLGVAIAGLLFLILVGWRLIPSRNGQIAKDEIIQIEDYLTELKVVKTSTCVGKTVRDLVAFNEGDVSILGIIRRKKQILSPSINEELKPGDILIIEIESEALHEFIDSFKLELIADKKMGKEIAGHDEMIVIEAVVKTDAPILWREISKLNLKQRFGVNLLAISRSGKKVNQRLATMKIEGGDVLLLRGFEQSIYSALPNIGCFPLETRGLKVGEPRRIALSLIIFFSAIIVAALGYLPIQASFLSAIVAMYFSRLLTFREIYASVDWSIIILLGALIPVGNALETTGAAKSLSEQFLWLVGGQGPTLILTLTLIGTMFLSDIVNNATAAILMVPIAANIASDLGVSPDPFLMAVAIGASCPFLTPIGHQCNTIILGPGGYRFSDYWRVGLPLEAVIVSVAIPLLLLFWPF